MSADQIPAWAGVVIILAVLALYAFAIWVLWGRR